MTADAGMRWPKTTLVVGPLCCLLLLFVLLLMAFGNVGAGPNGVRFGNVFPIYVSAAKVLGAGGNPFDPRAVCHQEYLWLSSQHVPVRQPLWNCRVGNPPLFLWALEPLGNFPFRITSVVWLLGLIACSAAGLYAAMQALGWRRRLLPYLIFLAMPPVALATFYGEPDGLVFAGIGIAFALYRRHPVWAGILLGIAWIKPPLALPLVGVMLLFLVADRSRFLFGFSIATVLFFTLTVATCGVTELRWWVESLLAFSGDTAVRGNQAGLIGLYVGWAPRTLRLVLEAATLGLAAIVTARLWWSQRGRPATLSVVACVWLVWFLATPYAQYYDEVVLAIPLLVLLGHDGALVTRRWPALALYSMFLTFPIGVFAPLLLVSPLSLPLLGICGALGYTITRSNRTLHESQQHGIGPLTEAGRSGMAAPGWQAPAHNPLATTGEGWSS